MRDLLYIFMVLAVLSAGFAILDDDAYYTQCTDQGNSYVHCVYQRIFKP
jgi:hypothetical protein